MSLALCVCCRLSWPHFDLIVAVINVIYFTNSWRWFQLPKSQRGWLRSSKALFCQPFRYIFDQSRDIDVQYTVGVASGVSVSFISVGDDFQDGDPPRKSLLIIVSGIYSDAHAQLSPTSWTSFSRRLRFVCFWYQKRVLKTVPPSCQNFLLVVFCMLYPAFPLLNDRFIAVSTTTRILKPVSLFHWCIYIQWNYDLRVTQNIAQTVFLPPQAGIL